MHRKLLFALAILAVIAVSVGCAQKPAAQPDTAAAQPDPAADKARMEADALAWFDHYAKADGEAMGNLYAEDALLMPPGAPAGTGRAAIKTFLGEDAARTKAAGLSLKNVSVTGSGVDGDTGWISGTYTVVDASGTTIDSGNYLSVHRRVNGTWPYIRDTWNSDRPSAPPAAAPGAPGAM
jgi:ketosteroid isomerase-like protein